MCALRVKSSITPYWLFLGVLTAVFVWTGMKGILSGIDETVQTQYLTLASLIGMLALGVGHIAKHGCRPANTMRPRFSCTDWFIAGYVLFGFASLFYTGNGLLSMMRSALKNWAWVIAYYWGKSLRFNRNLSPSKILGANILLLAYCLVCYLYFFSVRRNLFADRIFASNEVYYVLACLPMLLSWKSWKRNLSLTFIAVALLLSGKRTGQLAFVLALLPLLLGAGKQRSGLALCAIFFWLCATWIWHADAKMASFIDSRWERLLSADSSGRSDIWDEVWTLQQQSSSEEWVLGHGRASVEKKTLSGFSAHNDYLQVLFDQGIVCSLTLLGFVLSLSANAIRWWNYPLGKAYYAAVVLVWVLSLTSHVFYYPSHFVFLSAGLGYLNAWNTAYETAPPDGRRQLVLTLQAPP